MEDDYVPLFSLVLLATKNFRVCTSGTKTELSVVIYGARERAAHHCESYTIEPVCLRGKTGNSITQYLARKNYLEEILRYNTRNRT